MQLSVGGKSLKPLVKRCITHNTNNKTFNEKTKEKKYNHLLNSALHGTFWGEKVKETTMDETNMSLKLPKSPISDV